MVFPLHEKCNEKAIVPQVTLIGLVAICMLCRGGSFCYINALIHRCIHPIHISEKIIGTKMAPEVLFKWLIHTYTHHTHIRTNNWYKIAPKLLYKLLIHTYTHTHHTYIIRAIIGMKWLLKWYTNALIHAYIYRSK